MIQPPVHAQVYIPVPVHNYYAAFAYSISTGTLIGSWDYLSRHEAEEAALNFCEKDTSKDCIILAWFANQCGTFAVASNSSYGIAVDLYKDKSEQKALDICYEAGGDDCKVIRTICTSR